MKHTTSERSLLIRLSMMLFMEIAVHATYAPLQAIHMHRALGFSEQQVSFVYMARPLTSLVAPVAIGWIADRYLPAQICLATMSLVRAVALLWAGQATSFPTFAMAWCYFRRWARSFTAMACAPSLALWPGHCALLRVR
ncbi:MAG TPA: MFS transporter [Polyangiaceae bacterium]